MNKITLTLPASLHEQAKALAERERIPLDQLVTLALAEKLSALMTEDYLRTRAARGDRARFEQALAKVPPTEPDPQDRLGP